MAGVGERTVLMQRDNCQITVFDFEVEEYTRKGYSLISRKREQPKDGGMSPAAMQERIKQHEDRIADLEETVKVLLAKAAQKPKKPRPAASEQKQ